MSDFDDELASAWLDGELTPDEQARVEADPAVVEARHQLDPVRRVVAQPVGVPEVLREDHLARALDEWSATVRAEASHVVVPIRQRRTRSGPVWLSRAAVLLVAVGALGVGATAIRGQGSGEEAETAAVTAASGADQADSGLEAAGGGAVESAEADDAARAEEGQALAAPPPGDEQEQPAMGSAEVDPSVVSTAAAELAADGLVPADELARRLEDRFGPPQMWGLSTAAPPVCRGVLDERDPSEAPHLELLVPRPPGNVVLVIPATGPPRYLDPETCQPIS